MSDGNADPLPLPRVGPQAVDAEFQGGRLITDADALWLRETARKLGLCQALNAVMPDPRAPALVIQDQDAILAQRITALALGSEDLKDPQTLGSDPALQGVGRLRADRGKAAGLATDVVPARTPHQSAYLGAPGPCARRSVHRDAPDAAASQKVDSSTDTLSSPASDHYSSFAAMSCWWPISAPATSSVEAGPGDPQALGAHAPRRLAGREAHDSRRQRILPLAAEAVV